MKWEKEICLELSAYFCERTGKTGSAKALQQVLT